jgi:hypothetical protein
VVPSEDEKVLRVFDFVCQEQANGFQGLLASVHVVTGTTSRQRIIRHENGIKEEGKITQI